MELDEIRTLPRDRLLLLLDSVQRALRRGRVEENLPLYETMQVCLATHDIRSPPLAVAPKRIKDLSRTATRNVDNYLKGFPTPLTRGQRVGFEKILMTETIRRIRERGAYPASAMTVLQTLSAPSAVGAILDAAFPGYASSGVLIPMLLPPENYRHAKENFPEESSAAIRDI